MITGRLILIGFHPQIRCLTIKGFIMYAIATGEVGYLAH